MARRWRIRHKLMLGLATAFAILVLLLVGTLKGLWSYHVTMKSIESKLVELDRAENLKAAVVALDLPEKIVDPVGESRELKKGILEVEAALADYTAAFQATLDRELPNDGDMYIKDLLPALPKRIQLLRDANEIDTSKMFETGGPARLGEEYGKRVLPHIAQLKQDAKDLRSGVRTTLEERTQKALKYYKSLLGILITACVLGIVLMVTTVRFFYGWIFNPIRDLQSGVNHVAHGNFDHRIEVKSGDEMEELAEAFNDMTGRLHELYRDMAHQINERSRQLVRSERLASVGFLAAGVAHEINNPLASIAFCSEALEARLEELRGRLEVLGRKGNDVDIFAKYLKMIQQEAFRCKNITERLLEFSRNGDQKRDHTDLAGLVQKVIEVARVLPQGRDKEIVFRPTAGVRAWVSPEEIQSVVLNLVMNGLESMEEGGRLTIELRQRDGRAELVFTDTGCGMTDEVLENIFEPFFTRNRTGKGTGLGLTITHRIISQHGGEIEAASPGAEQGSTFTVRLPLQPAETVREESIGNAAA